MGTPKDILPCLERKASENEFTEKAPQCGGLFVFREFVLRSSATLLEKPRGGRFGLFRHWAANLPSGATILRWQN